MVDKIKELIVTICVDNNINNNHCDMYLKRLDNVLNTHIDDTVNLVLSHSSMYFNVDVDSIVSKKSNSKLIKARTFFTMFCILNAICNQNTIAKLFNRSHSDVSYLKKTHYEMCDTYSTYVSQFEDYCDYLNNFK